MAEVEGRGSVADADPTECELVIVSLQKTVKINFAYKKNSPLVVLLDMSAKVLCVRKNLPAVVANKWCRGQGAGLHCIWQVCTAESASWLAGRLRLTIAGPSTSCAIRHLPKKLWNKYISRALKTHEKVKIEKKHPPVTLGTGTCALCTMQQMRTSCCKGCKSKPLVLLSWPRVELSCAWSRGRRCELPCRTGHRRIVLSCVELENSQSQPR